jgi:hypothetical protein
MLKRELKKVNLQNINDPMKKWAKEEVQMVKKRIRKCSTSLAIKEMQMKTTLRFQLKPNGITIIKKTNNNKCW